MNKSYDTVYILSYGAMGDFVMLLNFLRIVHVAQPAAKVVVVTTRGAGLLRSMARAYPYITIAEVLRQFLPLVSGMLGRNLFVIPPTFNDVPRGIRLLSRLLTLRGTLAGFTSGAHGPRYDVAVPFLAKKLFYQNLNDLLGALGIKSDNNLAVTFVEDVSIQKTLKEPYIVVAPFASNPGKTLPMGRWSELLGFLLRNYPSHAVVIVGGSTDMAQAQALAVHGVRVRCGGPFEELVALIGRAALFVGADSGPTHVAGALRRPSVVIDNLRAVTWLPTYNPEAVVLTESKNCVCNGDKTGGDCNYVVDGVSYLRCMLDVPQERIHNAIAEKLRHD